ncbi:hypothetical protein [Terrisporobacter sp.]
MKEKSVRFCFLMSLLGFTFLLGGLLLLKFNFTLKLSPFPYILVGIGCGIFGNYVGNLIKILSLKISPEELKQLEIETNDERNIAINNKAKSKAYDSMIYILGAVLLIFSIMKVNVSAIIILVVAYLLIVGISIYYCAKYRKEM